MHSDLYYFAAAVFEAGWITGFWPLFPFWGAGIESEAQ
jgi:hypothetical protein